MRQWNNDAIAQITKGDNTPTNTLEEVKEAVKDGLSNHSGEFANPWIFKGSYSHELLADILNDIMNSERLFKNLEKLIADKVAQAVNKAEKNMWEKTTKAMRDILQENFHYRLMCGEVRDPDGKIDVMSEFAKYQELEPERKKFSEYLEGLKIELNRDETPNQVEGK